MKHEKTLHALSAWLLPVFMAMGGVGCLSTAFQLEPESLFQVFLWCLFVTGIGCLCFSSRSGSIFFLCFTALTAGWFWREGTVALQLESFLNRISVFYNAGYGVGYIRWSGEYLGDVPVDGGLVLCACLCALPACFAISRGKKLVLPVLLGLIPLFACMVLLDTVPGAFWLLVLIGSILVMVLPQSVRLRNRKDGLRLTAMLMLPVMLLSLLLFALVPNNGQPAHLEGLKEAMMNWFVSLPFVVQEGDGTFSISFSGNGEDFMSLTNVGPRVQTTYAVMDVYSTRTEFLYLRGQSFDVYDGTSWKASNTPEVVGNWPIHQQMTSNSSVSLSVRAARRFYYIPYYITDVPQLIQGKVPNDGREKEYSFQRYTLQTDAVALPGRLPTEFLSLPDSTRTAAKQYVRENVFVGEYANVVFETTEALATAIGKMVQRSAEYNLNTPRMPNEESDFAIWFLERSDTGYCVHFASAAAVLLRSQGIPARFVTGYTCQTRFGRQVTVTADQAHAWVEYYDKELGCWRVLDPTPAGNIGSNPGTSATVPPVNTAPTVPPVTTAPPATEPTETLPTEPAFTLPDPTAPAPPTEATTPPTQGPTEATGEPGLLPGEGPGSGTWDPMKLWTAIKPYVLALARILGAAALLIGQYLLRKRFRGRRMRTGRPNRRALYCWREALRMGKVLSVKPPERLLHLAEKAKFSQHTLTAGELAEFDQWLGQAQTALRAKPWYLRLLLRLIWAV